MATSIIETIFQMQMQLLRTTSVCLRPLAFFPLTQKSSGNPYLKICDFTQYFFADAPMEKKLVLPPLTAHPVQNIFFSLIKKILLQTLVEIIFCSGTLGPP